MSETCVQCSARCVSTDYNTIVCQFCGLERRVPLVPKSVPLSGAPLGITNYSRYKRFVNYVNCIFTPRMATHPPGKVLFLLSETAPYQSPHEIIIRLKALKTRNKSYQHLHMYCLKYQKNYDPPQKPSNIVRHAIIRTFNFIEDLFIHRGMKSFFSYPWLLIKLLTMYGLNQYVQFAKNIGCKKRKQKYTTMWDELGVHVMLLERGMVPETLKD